MPQKIYKDNTDQEVYFRLSSANLSLGEYIGESDGEALLGAAVVLKEYKKTATGISSSVLWNDTLKMWGATIPTANVTQYGGGLLTITGTDIVQATVEFETVRADGYYAIQSDITTIKAKTDLLTLAAINAEVDTALNDYDSPTKTELDSAFTEIKGADWATETLKNIKDTQVTTNQISSETYSSITNAGLLAVPDTVTNIKTVTDLLSLANIKTQAASALTDYDSPTKAEFDAAIANLATKTDLESISITVDGSELITASTVLTLPSNRTITFAELIVGIYQYRKW